MYCDAAHEATDFPSAGADSSSSEFQAIYWRCVCVFFKTARYFNSEAQLILFTNVGSLPAVDGFSISDFLSELEVAVVQLDRAFVLPSGFTSAFGNCFFKLDCIKYFSTFPSKVDTSILLLDNDIVITESLGDLADLILAKKYVFYDVDHAEYNGLSIREITELFAKETGRVSGVQGASLGGEFVGFLSTSAQELAAAIDSTFSLSLERFRRQARFLSTEEHIYAYIHLMLGFHVLPPDTNPFIKRIWTGRFNNQQLTDARLAIWHLPREKRYGFRRLFNRLRRNNTQNLLLSKQSLGKIMGVPKPNLSKILFDASHYLKIRMNSRSKG